MANQENERVSEQPGGPGGKANVPRAASFRSISQVAGVIAVLIGCSVLLGWALEVEVLKRALPGLVAMNPTTALAFVLAGVTLLLLGVEPADRGLGSLGRGLALVVALVGLLKLIGLLWEWDPGVDRLLFGEALEAEVAASGMPNRMAPNTALNFLLIGSGLLLLDWRTPRGHRWPAQYLVLAAGMTSLLTILGYAYGVGSFSGVASHIPMALHTALAFLVLVVGILCARPERGLVALLRSDSMGGAVARRLLPAAVLVPAILGWLRLEGERAGLYETEVGVALMVVFGIGILAAMVGLSARLLHRTDAERKRVEEALRKGEARTRAIVNTASDAIVTMAKNGAIRSFNRAAERVFGFRAQDAVGHPLRILMPERFRGLHEAGFRRYLETGEARVIGRGSVELVGLRKNGEEFPLELSLGVVREEDDALFTGIIRDITERKRAEEEIRRLNETLEERVAQRTAQLAERERRLEDLLDKLITSQEEERRRVAYEIHDGLTQTATAAHQHLQAFAAYHPPNSEEGQRELGQALELVKQTVREARHVIAGLRPTELDELGLAAALRRQAERLESEGLKVTYKENLGDKRLPVTLETALYRVAQQALTNAQKHAQTERMRLSLKLLEDRQEVRLRVKDWGCGFEPGELTSVEDRSGERVGLAGMSERITLLGGEFRVFSKPGAGTLVVANVPLGNPKIKDRVDDQR